MQEQEDLGLLCDTVPHTEGWYWQETHHDRFIVYGPEDEMLRYRNPGYIQDDGNPPFVFRSFLYMCWWCGSVNINPARAK